MLQSYLKCLLFLCCDFFVVVNFCRCWRCQLCLSSVRRVIPFRDRFGRFWVFFSSTVYVLLSICVAAQFSYSLVTMLFHQSRTNQGSARSYWHRLEPVSSHRVGGGVGGVEPGARAQPINGTDQSGHPTHLVRVSMSWSSQVLRQVPWPGLSLSVLH